MVISINFLKLYIMEKELKSEGKCIYCNQMVAKAALTKHLAKHLQDLEKEDKITETAFHVRIQVQEMFLNLLVSSDAQLVDLDGFLRAIWLECCGHMSSFTNPKNKQKGGGGMWGFFEAEDLLAKGKTKDYEKMMEEANGEIPKSRKVKSALAKNMKIDYEYDFGSTTELQITVVDEYPIKADNGIVLLSRNGPLEMLCEICNKEPATLICSVCIGNEQNTFCKKCAKQHAKTCSDFADYAAMPVVNSPRMGVCAYDGGSIDKQRDGAFVKR